jgi:hypothetical protein
MKLLSRDNLAFHHPVKSNIITLNMIHGFLEPNFPRLAEIKMPIKSRVNASINNPPRQQLLPQQLKGYTYVTVVSKCQQVLSSTFSLNPFSPVYATHLSSCALTHSSPLKPSCPTPLRPKYSAMPCKQSPSLNLHLHQRY